MPHSSLATGGGEKEEPELHEEDAIPTDDKTADGNASARGERE
jgi:hypothetical protein